MTRELTEAQQSYAQAGTGGMRKDAVLRAKQIVAQRSFVYGGQLAPTCLTCGAGRENRRLSKCNHCEGLSS